MDETNQKSNGGESRIAIEAEDINQLSNEEQTTKSNNYGNTHHDSAGPSGALLPGAASNLQTRLSKSEHNIRHIITPKDVANALNCIRKSNQGMPVNINLQDLKVPVYTEEIGKETSLLDVKKFMANCFKYNREARSETVTLQGMPVPLVRTKIEIQNSAIADKRNEIALPIPLPNEVGLVDPPEGMSNKKKPRLDSDRSEYGIGGRDSLASIGSNVCRICMTRGRERLISPCNCKGSLANVHLSCLERWLNQVGRNHCELCGYSYPAVRTPRYTILQALRLWFGNPRNRSHLQSDCLIFWLLSSVTAGLLAVCIVGTQYFVIEGNKFGKHHAVPTKEEGISHRITETAMNFFMAVVLSGYSVTVYLLWKEHFVTWNRWRRANVNVRLLLARDRETV